MRWRTVSTVLGLLIAASAYAGSTGTASLHMPQGSAAGTANGDYVSDAGGLNSVYRYFIEVPPGLGRLVVEIFDADIGRGGATEDDAGRDRDRAGGFTSQVDYTLIRPDGTTAATLLNCDFDTCNDNVWTAILNSTTAPNTAAGHWELRVDMDGGDELNAIGIRAHDGTSGAGGTELNVYADSMLSLGVNPDPGANSRSYTLYPYVTSGCSCLQNDFDRDTNNGDTGSVSYTSRGGTFTQTFASATLSGNNAWNRDSFSGWTSDTLAGDYGIWTLASTINTYNNGAQNGNYETTYLGSYATAANPPTANPVTNAFRIYLPTDAGAAPVKPYFEQELTARFGPTTPTVGQAAGFTVTLRIVNPTPYAITFSATNLVTANVPGSGVVYAGFIGTSQGSLVAAPAIGGTGNITWNPGSVAAGATAIFAYNVTVTPTSAGQRLPVTATPASGNGTRAQFVDETGNTTQTRARYLLGPVCELAVTEGLATEVVLSSFESGRGQVRWSTASEAGTIGFNLLRADGSRVNTTLIPANRARTYAIDDPGQDGAYVIEEVTASGRVNRIGPLASFKRLGADAEPRTQVAEAAMLAPASDAVRADALMVGVRQTGIVRVPLETLKSVLGPSSASALRNGNLSVTYLGGSVTWTTTAAADALLFYGEKADSIYTDERVYRVELKRGTPMKSVSVTGAGASPSTYAAERVVETDVFPGTVLPLDPESDYWFWDFVLSGDATYGRKAFTVAAPDVSDSSGATLEVRLQGAFKDVAHRARVIMNGVPIGEATWSSFDATSAVLAIPQAVLREGANAVEIEGVLEGGAAFDVFYVDGFTIRYKRLARPENGALEMPRGSGRLAAGPFASAPMILDITSDIRPSLLTGASFANGIASLNAPASAKTLFFATSFVTPSSLRGMTDKSLRKVRADYVVVTEASMRGAAEALARLRQRDGLTTYVADVQQIYDELNGGNSSPHAIRTFLAAVAPRYAVLAGSGTIDYKAIDIAPGPVPPLLKRTSDGLFASDTRFADRDNDGIPEIALGRIPVSSAAELMDYVEKLETNRRDAGAPMVFSADAVDRSADFRAASREAEAPMGGRAATRIYVDEQGYPGARAALLNAWRSGTPLVSWVGHGGLDQLASAGVLTAGDAPSLTSDGPLPVLVAMTCTINRFEDGLVEPLGAALTRVPAAGALAVWSASGLSVHGEATELQQTFMHLAAQSPGARIGDLIVAALTQHPSATSSLYLLLGDPAIRLEIPTEVPNGGPPSPRE